jgi:iron complex transport system permease protein
MTNAAVSTMPATRAGSPTRTVATLVGLAALLALAAVGRLVVGDTPGWPTSPDVLAIRVDRLLLGLIVGSALGVSGTVLQALLRNPLASEYVLGISTGAALGVMAAWAGWLVVISEAMTQTAAIAGALATMAVVYALAQRRGRVDPIGLILVGVIVNALNGAAIMFINYLNPHGLRGDMVRWMMGHLDDNVARSVVLGVGGVTLLGWAVAAAMGRAMDVATFSDSEAMSMGVNLPRLRLVLFAVAGILTAGSVVLAGPVGFVGLICPHLVRLLIGPAHRGVVIGAGLAGALVIVSADTLIKIVGGYANIGLMPIGVLTAIVGGPVFLVLLRGQLGRVDA